MNAHAPIIVPAGAFAIIQLSRRSAEIFCLVDQEDHAWAKQWLWNCGYFYDNKHRLYAKRNTGRERASVYLHREIMQRVKPQPAAYARAHLVDHINGHTLDNRRANLRWATPRQNRQNQRLDKPGNSIDAIVALHQALLAGEELRGA